MTDFREYARELLEDFDLCIRAKPKSNVADVQLEKDAVGVWAVHLNKQVAWGSDSEIAEACHQLAPRLEELKKKLVFEILKHGTV